MYCRPFTAYVIGDALIGAGRSTDPTSAPVALSYARSIAPRGRVGSVVTCGSPAMTSVLVTSVPTMNPGCPVRGIVMPLSA